MIVPMKKAVIIAQSKDAGETVAALGRLGVVHVENQTIPAGKSINSLKEDMALLDKAIGIISSPELRQKDAPAQECDIGDWRSTVKHIIDTAARIDHLSEFSRGLAAKIAAWEPWGDFDPGSIAALKERGVNIRLCRIPAGELSGIDKAVIIRKIAVTRTTAYCALLSSGPINVPYSDEGLPNMSLSAMRSRFAEDGDIVRELTGTLSRFAGCVKPCAMIRERLKKEIESQEAILGMGSSGSLSYLVGYFPEDKADELAAAARRCKWGLAITDPAADDEVPTLVRNPKWVSVIEPVFKLIEIVPGYKEMDISPVFLLFLSLFFGMIIGDAGYGAIYILITAFFHRKLGAGMKDHTVFHLFYLFSSFAVIWGIVTGTVFGQEWYVKAGFNGLIPALNDTRFIQAFCFFLGAVHLTIAQAWQGIRKLPSLAAIADAGWICILWSAFFLARMLILGDELPALIKPLLIAGAALVVFFSNPQRNIFKMAGEGLGNLALNAMNNFTDVVSYIRLFAVGLAGVAIADTVNSLAASVGGGNIIVQSLIVFIGHTINIVLGPMSVLVHGLRLNVLEFSSHAGLTWSGRQYKPLANIEK